MKVLEIDETPTQLVIKVAGSQDARVVKKDDAEDIREQLLSVLAAAPEAKEQETVEEEASEDVPDEDSLTGLLNLGRAAMNSEQGRSFIRSLEKLPKGRRHRKNSA